MKYLVMIVVLVGLVLLVGDSLKGNKEVLSQKVTAKKDLQENIAPGYASQTKQMGEVVVEVTPLNLSSDSETIFEVSLNTHSVELSYDFTKIAKLTDDKGNSYEALDWKGGEGGHHLQGELTFDELKSGASKVLLTIDGIDNQKADFSWELSQLDSASHI